MRSSKSRSRSKNNRNRSVGNIVNRVFDSSGPEGKVRGTPQQIIDKFNQLARDAQLSNDRVATENFQQHAEHYTRMLSEALREAEARRDGQDQQQGRNRDDGRGDWNDRNGGASGSDGSDDQGGGQRDGDRGRDRSHDDADDRGGSPSARPNQERGGDRGRDRNRDRAPGRDRDEGQPQAAHTPDTAGDAARYSALGDDSTSQPDLGPDDPGAGESMLVDTPENAADRTAEDAQKKPRRPRKLRAPKADAAAAPSPAPESGDQPATVSQDGPDPQAAAAE